MAMAVVVVVVVVIIIVIIICLRHKCIHESSDLFFLQADIYIFVKQEFSDMFQTPRGTFLHFFVNMSCSVRCMYQQYSYDKTSIR
jgi:hypothetical protein